MRLTPQFFLLPHILHLVGEHCQVVPDNYRHCRLFKVLKYARSSSEIPGAYPNSYFSGQAFDRGVG